MTSEEYQEVKKIFQSAIELLPEKRAEFLDNACRGNKALRHEVERLLNAEDTDFMEEPAMAQMADVIVQEEIEEDLAHSSYFNDNIDKSNRYKIISKIGTGGMGEVYLAKDTKLKRQVAIKVLSKKFSQDTDILNRFKQEAQSASALNHPNIITVFEIKKQDNFQYIVSEYIEGKTLAEQISKTKLPLPLAIDISIQIASALTATHEAGIIHRDIKSENVMIRKDGIVKVLDFGLAKPNFTNLAAENDLDSVTREKIVTIPGMIMGTPQYMSPEQASAKKIDARTDIFSFGVVLYEMITGNQPFTGNSPLQIISSILKDEPTDCRKYVEDVPPELENIINKSLRKDRSKRYQGIGEVLLDLENLRDELKFEAKLSHTVSAKGLNSSTENTASIVTGRRFSYIHAFIFLLFTTAIASAFWWFTSTSSIKSDLPQRSSLTTSEIANWSSAPGELFSTGAFSPNGKMVAFGSTKSGTKSIWIKQTNADEAVQITKDRFENNYPVWSPNGDEIAFLSTRGEKTGIWRSPFMGSSPSLLTTIDDESTHLRFWSKSGKIYFESNRNLFTLDVESNEQKQLTDFDVKSPSINNFAVSKDEKQFAYIANETNKWKVILKTFETSTVRELIEMETEINSLVWHPDGNQLLFSALTKGIFQIFTINIKNGGATQISFSENDSLIQDVSTDGKNILYSSAKENSNLWYFDLENSNEAVFRSDIASELWTDVSTDNQTIVFQSTKNLSQGNKLLNGSIIASSISAEDRSIKLAENGFLPKWSYDGKRIAYLQKTGKEVEIWITDSLASDSKKLTTGGIDMIGFTMSPYNRLETQYYDWSPDSNKIAYISNRNGAANIWSVSTDLSGKDLPQTNYTDDNLLLYCPIWSSDGKKIAYASQSKKLNSKGRKTRKFSIFDGETSQVSDIFESNEQVRLIGWSENEEELIFALTKTNSSLPPEVLLYEVSIKTGEQKLLSTLKDTYFYNIFLSPDRKTFAYVSRLEKNDDVWIKNLRLDNKPRKLTNNKDPRIFFSSLSWSPDGKIIFFGKQSRFSLLSQITNFE